MKYFKLIEIGGIFLLISPSEYPYRKLLDDKTGH